MRRNIYVKGEYLIYGSCGHEKGDAYNSYYKLLDPTGRIKPESDPLDRLSRDLNTGG